MAVDLAAPTFAVAAFALDGLLELLEVAVDAALQEAEGIPRRLDRSFRLGIDAKRDLGLGRSHRVEQDSAGVLGTVGALPGDPGVRRLIGDLGLPLLLLAGDPRGPKQRPVIELLDRLHAVHELREILELGPLVVRDANRNGHRDRLFESGHNIFLQAAGRPRTSTCAGWPPASRDRRPKRRGRLGAAVASVFQSGAVPLGAGSRRRREWASGPAARPSSASARGSSGRSSRSVSTASPEPPAGTRNVRTSKGPISVSNEDPHAGNLTRAVVP